jgi:hypothetical protein
MSDFMPILGLNVNRVFMSCEKYLMIRQIEERLEENEQAVNLTKLFIKELRARRQSGRGEGSFTREQLYHLQVVGIK